MQVNITNKTNKLRVYFGIEFPPGVKINISGDITAPELMKDSVLIPDWAQGYIGINDGTKDIQNVNELIALLKGNAYSIRTTDNRLIVKDNVRPIGTSGYFTSRDDAPVPPTDIGNGSNLVELNHKVGDPVKYTVTQRFNVENNRSWIHEGYIHFKNAQFDRFCFYISTEATPYSIEDNTNFMLYPSKKLILPAAGNGNVNIDIENLTTLVSVTPKTDTGLCPSAFWNADFDTVTGKYGNLTPAPNGDGKYNMFYEEYILKRYLNNIGLIGDGNIKFETSDPSELATNLKCNYMFTTTGEDHNWQAIVFVSMFREKII